MLAKGPKYRIPKSINWTRNLRLLMTAFEDYTRKWLKSKLDEPELDTLSEFIKAIRSRIQKRIQKLILTMSIRVFIPFKNLAEIDALSSLHDNISLFRPIKPPILIVFVCKYHSHKRAWNKQHNEKSWNFFNIIYIG